MCPITTETVKIESPEAARQLMMEISVSAYGVHYMAPKLIFRVVRVNGISSKAANILKQEMLSIGGEVAVAEGVAGFSPDPSDCLIAGTLRQYELLVKKLKLQPFGGLQHLAEQLGEMVGELGVKSQKPKENE